LNPFHIILVNSNGVAMKHILKISIIASSIYIFGCATTNTTQGTQLQIREFQTRSYETNDTKMVMKAMLNVLQDYGFIIKNATLDLGILSAEKSVDIETSSSVYGQNSGKAMLDAYFESRWKKAAIIECTSNVSEYGKHTRVRVNFQMKIMDNKGGVVEVKQLDDEKYYQEFFSKVDRGIFIQKEKL
jgi:hypothetical protein